MPGIVFGRLGQAARVREPGKTPTSPTSGPSAIARHLQLSRYTTRTSKTAKSRSLGHHPTTGKLFTNHSPLNASTRRELVSNLIRLEILRNKHNILTDLKAFKLLVNYIRRTHRFHQTRRPNNADMSSPARNTSKPTTDPQKQPQNH
ncbi:hypothetical protein CROQUDRAFT_85889 [Cronartium quercuum f. sp. fusiforme G11]|uniref:Uncharacterized protein n=1 Tax=Cronartium quercuum f. sp. fusiforme G11 TaxID=708437 RepID=A0A9P6NTW7_9BASI|nr:hypothetical protein CROQUDRAFT_85889 [Cronartium quercuum f. sp. fusiforme G11]